MIARFMEQYPKVEVWLESTNRRVDMIREGFDIAIRVRFPPLEDSDLVIRKLAESPQRLVASPSVIRSLSRPLVPGDLSTLPSLAWDPTRVEHEWRLDGPDGATAAILHKPRFVTEDMVALHLAVLRGVGVCLLPTFIVQWDLDEGRLIDLLPEWTPKAGVIHVLFPSRRGLLPSVRALLDFLADQYAAPDHSDKRLSQ
jgi:DNA-binding transcriptional LysR family regulator